MAEDSQRDVDSDDSTCWRHAENNFPLEETLHM